MSTLATTRMSTRGQVVIPEDIRIRLGLEPGVQFVVVGNKDVVMLKVVSAPSFKDFDLLIKEAKKMAKKAGILPTDIAKAIRKSRKSPSRRSVSEDGREL